MDICANGSCHLSAKSVRLWRISSHIGVTQKSRSRNVPMSCGPCECIISDHFKYRHRRRMRSSVGHLSQQSANAIITTHTQFASWRLAYTQSPNAKAQKSPRKSNKRHKTGFNLVQCYLASLISYSDVSVHKHAHTHTHTATAAWGIMCTMCVHNVCASKKCECFV